MYELNARRKERAFLRSLKKGIDVFKTGRGVENKIVSVTKDDYIFSTTVEGSKNRISRSQVRKAIHYMYAARTATRKELESFSNFSSAIMGLLHMIFDKVSKYVKTAKGLMRLSLNGTRFFFAGCDHSPSDMKAISQNGGRYILLSYYWIRSRHAWKRHAKRYGLNILLDSGAYSIWKKKEKGESVEDINIEDYADFIKNHEDVLYGYFNLDVVGDPQKTKDNESYLRSLGLSPIPVFHAKGDLDELANIIEEDYPVIGIGGSVGMSEQERIRYFTPIFERFPEQNFHFLGGGSSRLFKKFNWFSADSTTWIARRYGYAVTAEGQKYMPESDDNKRLSITLDYLTSLELV